MGNKMTRKDFLKKLGIGVGLFAVSMLMPKTANAAVIDNLGSGGVQNLHVGPTQPETDSDYLAWINTTDGCYMYRESTTSSTWNYVASVWS